MGRNKFYSPTLKELCVMARERKREDLDWVGFVEIVVHFRPLLFA